MSTNRVKWDDTANRLTAYCSDDSGETEIGPVKWDDTNNRLELNCDSTDYQVKWNDATNVLEAQGVGSGCCGGDENCNTCETGYTLTISGLPDGCANGTYTLTRDHDCIYGVSGGYCETVGATCEFYRDGGGDWRISIDADPDADGCSGWGQWIEGIKDTKTDCPVGNYTITGYGNLLSCPCDGASGTGVVS